MRTLHEGLADVAASEAGHLTGPSYCRDWTAAEVFSQLGSGTELFGRWLDAGLKGTPAPGFDTAQPIWDRWNAKTPEEQAGDSVAADAAFVDRLAGAPADVREGWKLDLFGRVRTMSDIARMRLSEVTVHTWDITAVRTPDVTLSAAATPVVLEGVVELVPYVGKPSPTPLHVRVITTEPDTEMRLDIDENGARLGPASEAAGADATLRIPAEAFIRLLYGRLDAEHTPAITVAEGVDLEALRTAFPGV